MITPTTASEKLLFSTVRIEASSNAGLSSVGTGFFFNFSLDDNRSIPTIITNKHVVEGTTHGSLQVHEAKGGGDDFMPSGRSFTVELDQFEKRWFRHPEEEVDLCAMPFEPLRHQAEEESKTIFSVSLDESLVRDDANLKDEFGAVEEVLMIGYPIGLWDETNNLPIIRRGISATHPGIDWEGNSIQIADIACFPGSSGSPVLIVDEGTYKSKTGGIVMGGDRIVLLGALYAGPQWTAEGDVRVREIPTSRERITVETGVMIHLGYVVKAKEILALGAYMKNMLRSQGAL